MNFKDEFEKVNDMPNSTDESSEVTDRNIEEYETLASANESVQMESASPLFEKEEDVIIVEDKQSERLTEDVASSVNRIEKKKGNKKRNYKGFASTIAAGVVGSVLTLAVLPHTDYIQNFYPNVEGQVISSSEQKATEVGKTVTAQPTAVTASSSLADTVEHLSKTIVGITNIQQQQGGSFYGIPESSQGVQRGSGSGVIFKKDKDIAYIVTNNHVVEGASKLEISLFDGEKITAEVVGTDALTDLAVLKIDAKYVAATAEFGDSSTLRPGDPVYAIGNPLGLNLSRTVTQGIVSATNRSIPIATSAGNWETNVVQTDAAINPGNSGGALINPQGLVIGINSAKISESGVEGLGFAIPSNDVIPIVNELIKNGKIERPYLGVGLMDLDQIPQFYWPTNVQEGVMITTVEENSVAAIGGLHARDVIVKMNGEKITSSSELRKFLYTKVSIGDEIKMEVNRDGKMINLTVKLAK
jgi:serine protease Do